MDVPITARAALLQVLIRSPGYGLDLIERVKERTKGVVVLGPGSVYPALRSLERDGLLETYEGDASEARGNMPRIYYRLTAKGAREAVSHQSAIAGLFRLKPSGATHG